MSDDVVDDLMLHDSESMGVYEDHSEQPEVATEEHNLMSSSYPIMDELLEWFDKWASETNTIDSLTVESKVPLESQLIAMQLMTTKIKSKRNELSAKFTEYKRQLNGGESE